MKNSLLSIVVIFIAIASLAGAIFYFSSRNSENNSNNIENEKISVLVSILPQIEFVKEVGKDKVDVFAIIKPGESPESYSLTANDLVNVSDADLYFRIGYIPFEKANIETISSTNQNLKVVNIPDNTIIRYFTEDEKHSHEEEEHESSEDEHNENEIDPHLWLSIENIKIHVDSIANELSNIDPENKSFYTDNALDYINRLEDLQRNILEELQNLTAKHLLVFHPAWGYLASEFGLEQIAIEQDGNDPTADDLANIISFAIENEIGVIFVQSQFSTSASESIANELGIKVVSIDPLAQNYIENMNIIAKTLKENL